MRACNNCGAKFGVRCVDDHCCERDDREATFAVGERCTAIADRVVPKYRAEGARYSCGGVIARAWGAAWNGACLALGGDPADYVG